MGRIHLLDQDVINKIAAGEVVERPASVIKELVENALDAGASRIAVRLKDGGREAIIVTDDGTGMDEADLRTCVERHATSKLESADDLFSLMSMGFRGEALAAIASVSKFSIASCQVAGKGHKLLVDGGRQSLLAWTGPKGTTVVVEDLFRGIPARAKFLRQASTEMAHCHELMVGFAIGHPEVGFELEHNGRLVLTCEAVSAPDELKLLRERMRQVVPKLAIDKFVVAKQVGAYGTVYGLISPPGEEQGTAKNLWTFVNGRLVRDPVLRRAILRGYHSHLLKGRYPACVLHLNCDPALVDVNVHPAKTELRFQYLAEVQNTVTQAIRSALRQGAWSAPSADDGRALIEAKSSYAREETDKAVFKAGSSPPTYRVSEYRNPEARYGGGQANAEIGQGQGLQRTFTFPEFKGEASASLGQASPSRAEDIPWHELTFKGSFARCYLFFEHQGRLLVVDQHAFHERILYERLLKNQALLREAQDLLVPEEVIVSAAEADTLARHAPDLQKIGLKLRKLQDDAVEVTSIPCLLSGSDLSGLLAQLAKSLDEAEAVIDVKGHLSHDLLATVACHSAVRAGEELTDADLRQLVTEARSVDFFHNCPHGRRVLRWFNESEVGRWFDRT